MRLVYIGNAIGKEAEQLTHHGIKGQKWGIRRYQNADGSLTAAGKKRYGKDSTSASTVKTGTGDTNTASGGGGASEPGDLEKYVQDAYDSFTAGTKEDARSKIKQAISGFKRVQQAMDVIRKADNVTDKERELANSLYDVTEDVMEKVSQAGNKVASQLPKPSEEAINELKSVLRRYYILASDAKRLQPAFDANEKKMPSSYIIRPYA